MFIFLIFTFQLNVTDRLVVLQHFAAQLELQVTKLKKRNSHLERRNESLKRGRDTLRVTLRKVHTHSHKHMQNYSFLQRIGPKSSASVSEGHQVTDYTFPLNFQTHHLVPIL